VSPRSILKRLEDINVLVHPYFRIDEEILWKASQEDIPSLIDSIEKIIAFEE
jgi:uncharacterized protein with HEPN domain